jgi:MOSC domain-containing protein YiiM
MLTLAELTSRFPRPGRVEQILVRPHRKGDLHDLDAAQLLQDGIDGDHARPGKRAVSLIQSEHLPVLRALSGHDALTAADLRRNLVISGLNLSATRGKCLQIGAHAVLEVTGPCAPCSRMEHVLGVGGYNAMRGHGGWCAQVLRTGPLSVGDPIIVLKDADSALARAATPPM